MIGELALVSATTGLMLEIVEYNYMFFLYIPVWFCSGVMARHTHTHIHVHVHLGFVIIEFTVFCIARQILALN